MAKTTKKEIQDAIFRKISHKVKEENIVHLPEDGKTNFEVYATRWSVFTIIATAYDDGRIIVKVF